MTDRQQAVVPLIGPTVAGPLGVAHLPRMWLKGILSAAGLLYEGYFDYYIGFNKRVVDGIGLDADPWFAFLTTMPSYLDAEGYVRTHATKLDPASVAALNTEIATALRPEENAAPIRERAGLNDSDVRVSAVLISYDDWCTVHELLVSGPDRDRPRLVPLVSSSQSALLGVQHLPRLWLKALLAAANALAEGSQSGAGCSLDRVVCETIGLDLDEAITYIHRERPTYVQFERWVGDRIGTPSQGFSIDDDVLRKDMAEWQHMHDHVRRRALGATSDR